jgi:hypothetical protein
VCSGKLPKASSAKPPAEPSQPTGIPRGRPSAPAGASSTRDASSAAGAKTVCPPGAGTEGMSFARSVWGNGIACRDSAARESTELPLGTSESPDPKGHDTPCAEGAVGCSACWADYSRFAGQRPTASEHQAAHPVLSAYFALVATTISLGDWDVSVARRWQSDQWLVWLLSIRPP